MSLCNCCLLNYRAAVNNVSWCLRSPHINVRHTIFDWPLMSDEVVHLIPATLRPRKSSRTRESTRRRNRTAQTGPAPDQKLTIGATAADSARISAGMNGNEIQLPDGRIATDYIPQNARNHGLNIMRTTTTKNASTPIIKKAMPVSLASLMGSPKTPEKPQGSVPGSPRRGRPSIPQCYVSGTPRRISDHPYQYPYLWSPSNRAQLQWT